MRALRLCAILLAQIVLRVGDAGASPELAAAAATRELQLRLIAQQSHVRPGQTLLVALEQQLAPGWHTFWRNPGDAGQATVIEWMLPEGAEAGPILWPLPARIEQRIGGLVVSSYGYEGQVLLLSEILVPRRLRPGEYFKLEASVSWLVCGEVCLAQEVALQMRLPVAAQPQDSEHAKRLAAAFAALPASAPWPVEAQAVDGGLRLRWGDAATGAMATSGQFFPDGQGLVRHAASRAIARDGARWRLDLAPGETQGESLSESTPDAGQSLDGLLVLGEGANARAYQVHAPVLAGPPAPLPTRWMDPWRAGGLLLLAMALLYRFARRRAAAARPRACSD